MAHPYHHALSSVRRFGGAVDDYLPLHAWFDESKQIIADFRKQMEEKAKAGGFGGPGGPPGGGQ